MTTLGTENGLVGIERLVRIETKLDVLVDTTAERGKDHETRLRSLERVKWAALGGALVTGGGGGALAAKLVGG